MTIFAEITEKSMLSVIGRMSCWILQY